MKLIWVLLFLAFDLYALTFFQLGGAPPGEAAETKPETAAWCPSKLLGEGAHFRYDISRLGRGGQETLELTLDFVGGSEDSFNVLVAPGERIVVKGPGLLAAGQGEPSALWNAYIRHPALPSFSRNPLRVGANWSYTSEDGYFGSVMVSHEEEMLGYKGFVCEIRERSRASRLYIAAEIPLPVRYEADVGGPSGFASVLKEWYL